MYCCIEVLLECIIVFLQDKIFSVKYSETWLWLFCLSCLSSRCSKYLIPYFCYIGNNEIKYFPIASIDRNLFEALGCLMCTLYNHLVILSDLFKFSFCNMYKIRLIFWLGSADHQFLVTLRWLLLLFFGNIYIFFKVILTIFLSSFRFLDVIVEKSTNLF